MADKNLPQYIYKYYNFECEHSISNIEKNIVYLSIPSEFNDPYDCSICLDDIDILREKYIEIIRNQACSESIKNERIEALRVSENPIITYYEFV